MAKKKKTFKKRPAHQYLASMLAVILVSGLIINLVTPSRAYSEAENRPLASFPSITWSGLEDGEFMEEVNTWYSDQFTGRQTYFHMNYLIRKICGDREINDVFLGKRTLLQQNEQGNPEIIDSNMAAINAFADATQIDSYFLLAPGAATIQTQKLPAFAPVVDASSNMDHMYQSLDSEWAHGVDIRDTFESLKDKYIYYKTDHHWTSYGAGEAFRKLMEAQGTKATLGAYEAMPVSTSFQGTLASKTGSILLKDQIDIYVGKNNPDYIVTWADGSKTGSIYDIDALDQKDQYEVFLGSNQSIIRIQTTADSDTNLLIFKDSYANNMIQFFLPLCSTITIVDPRYYYEDISQVLEMYSINEIAYIFSYNTFVTDNALSDVLNAYTESLAAEEIPEETEQESATE